MTFGVGSCGWGNEPEFPTPVPSPEESIAVPSSPGTPTLQQVLSDFLTEQGSNLTNTSYEVEYVDLNDNGRDDALVLLTSQNWCGSGGCTLLVFEGSTQGFEFVSRSTVVNKPIVVSETRTSGWRDLIVTIGGGGGSSGQVALKFNGETYPVNPSMQPLLDGNQPIRGLAAFGSVLSQSPAPSPSPTPSPTSTPTPSPTPTPDPAPSPSPTNPPAEVNCERRDREEAYFETTNYLIAICRTPSERRYYLGVQKDDASQGIQVNNVTIDGETYVATTGNTQYRINRYELVIYRNGRRLQAESVLLAYIAPDSPVNNPPPPEERPHQDYVCQGEVGDRLTFIAYFGESGFTRIAFTNRETGREFEGFLSYAEQNDQGQSIFRGEAPSPTGRSVPITIVNLSPSTPSPGSEISVAYGDIWGRGTCQPRSR